jgi:hypothetical protein
MAGNRRPFGTYYRMFLGIVLLMLVFAIFMGLRRPPRPTLPMTRRQATEQAQSFDRKMDELMRGETKEARFTSDEVSAAYSRQLGGEASSTAASGTSTPAGGQQKSPELTPNTPVDENAPIHTVDVDFHGDQVTGQFTSNIYGRDVFITISGRLGSRDGYATFDPTGFKVGDFSVPVSWVNSALQKKLAEPETHEQLKLPDFVRSVRIENGELVVEEKELAH